MFCSNRLPSFCAIKHLNQWTERVFAFRVFPAFLHPIIEPLVVAAVAFVIFINHKIPHFLGRYVGCIYQTHHLIVLSDLEHFPAMPYIPDLEPSGF